MTLWSRMRSWMRGILQRSRLETEMDEETALSYGRVRERFGELGRAAG